MRAVCTLAAVAVIPLVPLLAAAQHFDLTAIAPGAPYTAERGYGYETPATRPPFFFSIHVPEEGNYRVTATFGNPSAATVTTVKAELRRLMVEEVRTAPGKFETRTFLVNVRRPQIPGGGEVKLKPRETQSEAWAWDDKLTLEFTNALPGVRAIDVEKVGVPTLYIAGDSTSTDQPLEPFNSWGQMLTRFFKPEIAVANWGESGESLRGYIRENRLAKLMSAIQPGDWLFIQMGHNDQKERGEGVGAFTTYKADLERFIAEARAHGATPVLVTPVHRLTFGPGGRIVNSLGDYPEAVRRTAREQKVAQIDLNAMSQVFYEAIGAADLPKAFADNDTTHHNNYGSYQLAKCVVEGIRGANLALVKYLDAPPYDPAHPDPIAAFQIPAEPRASAAPRVFVIGDSTANNANRRGWGDPIASYFDIPTLNRARAGRSSRTFLTERLWEGVRTDLKPGDFVLIQFGHNDGGPPDRDRARGSLPGIGEEATEFTMPDGHRETVHTFGWYLRRFIRETKAAGATPIVLSLTVRSIWNDGKVERGSGRFGEWSAEAAKAEDAAFVNVTAAIADTYDQMGEAKVKKYFPEDHTHTTPEGAELNASLIVAALKGVPYSPLADHLSTKGRDVKPYPAPAATLPARLGLPVPANPALPTLFLIGDSTVRNGRADGANGQWGWGEPIVDLFDTARLNVVNRAVGGLSSRTFLTQGWRDRTLALMKPGDFVIMQFGHNDSGPLDDTARARGTLPGAGEETREIDNPLTLKHETVHTYGWYLRKFIADARAKGVTPIVCTLVPRKIWNDGRIARDAATYAGWARAVAASEKAPLIDLNEIVARHYDELGAEKVDPLFADPHTHTSRAGAELNARIVVESLKSLQPDPLAAFLR